MSDMSTAAGQAEHYAAVKARLGLMAPEPRVRLCRAQPVIEAPPEPEPTPPAAAFAPIRILGIEELPPEDTVLAPLPRWKRVAREVAQKHGLTVRELCGPWRNERLVIARHEAMYRCWMELDLSFPTIGRLFGGRDHTTALYAIHRHQKRMGLAAKGKSISGRFLLTPEIMGRINTLRANGKTWPEIGVVLGVAGKRVRDAVSRERARRDADERAAA